MIKKLTLLFLISLTLFACKANYASYQGGHLSQAEIDAFAKDQITELQQRMQEIRHEAATRLLLRKLIETDSQGQSMQKYFSAFVNRQKESISDEAAKFYLRINRGASIPIATEDILKAKSTIAASSMDDYHDLLFLELKQKYQVKIHQPIDFVHDPVDFSMAGLPKTGSDQAEVVIIVFTDFQDPYSKKAFHTLNKIRLLKPNGLQLIYSDFPLTFHRSAKQAANAAHCAGDQQQFWAYHDALFLLEEMENNNQQQFHNIAQTIGLDMVQFKDCFTTNKHLSRIQEQTAKGKDAGVTGTPSFIINGLFVSGALPLNEFIDRIESWRK